MTEFRIEKMGGDKASPIVTPLYSEEGKGIVILSSDLFFVCFLGAELVGSVRLRIEQSIPLLRTMRIARKFQSRGFGRLLLKCFESHLEGNGIESCYCIAYGHLERFYGEIGFEAIEDDNAPSFLQERLREYRKSGGDFLCMHRISRTSEKRT